MLNIEGQDAVRAVIKSDVYWNIGIWADYEVKRLNRVGALTGPSLISKGNPSVSASPGQLHDYSRYSSGISLPE